MALMNCPECRADISDKASACPQCGYRLAPGSVVSTPVLRVRLTPAMELLNRAFRLCRSRAKTLAAVMVMELILLSFPGYLLRWRAAAPLVLFAFPAIFAWGIGAIILILARGEERSVVQMYRRALARVPAILWTSLLLILSVALGSLLLVIPGIVLAVWFSMGIVVAVLEDSAGFRSLARSKRLVQGQWWPVLWRQLAAGLAIGFLVVASGFIPAELGAIRLAQFVMATTNAVLAPVGFAYQYLIYQELAQGCRLRRVAEFL